MGIDQYVWSTALDERVRHTHAVNEGVVFRWDSPPGTGHPGYEIQCRCVANAIIPKRVKGPGYKGALNWPTPGGAQQIPVGAQGLTPEQLAFYEKRRKEIFAELKAQAEAQGKAFSVQYSSKLARAQALKEAKAYGVVVPAPVPVAAKPDTPIRRAAGGVHT